MLIAGIGSIVGRFGTIAVVVSGAAGASWSKESAGNEEKNGVVPAVAAVPVFVKGIIDEDVPVSPCCQEVGGGDVLIRAEVASPRSTMDVDRCCCGGGSCCNTDA